MKDQSGTFRLTLAGAVLIVTAAALWGLSGIFVTRVLGNCNGTPVSLAFWRDFAGFITLLGFTIWIHPQRLKIKKKDLPWLISMGVFLGSFHIVYNQSVMLNGVAVTTVLQTAMPAVVALAALYFWNETLTWTKVLSMVIIFIGTALASGMHVIFWKEMKIAGLFTGLSVPFLYAGWSVCGKNMVSTYGASACLTIAFGIASVILLPFQLFTRPLLPLNPTMAVAFTGLIIISTFGGFTLYLLGMKYIPAGIASILVMSEIFFAGVYAWLFLGERLTPVQSIGTGLVMLGVVLLSCRLTGPEKSL